MLKVPCSFREIVDPEKVPDGFSVPLGVTNCLEGKVEKPGIALSYWMETQKNEKLYQEDSCSLFSWDQQFLGETETVPLLMFAVADGHSTRQADSSKSKELEDGGLFGEMVAEKMRLAIETMLKGFEKTCFEDNKEELKKQLEDQALMVDQALMKEGLGRNSGSTLSFALVSQDHIVLGNTGDSSVFYASPEKHENGWLKCITSANIFEVEHLHHKKENEVEIRKDLESMLSEFGKDSRPYNVCREYYKEHLGTIEEFKRVTDAGLELTADRAGALAMTRAFGDFDQKSNEELTFENQGIIATPHITIKKRVKLEREFLGLFTDGVIFEYKYTDYYNRETKYSFADRYSRVVEDVLENWENDSLVSTSDMLHQLASGYRGYDDNEGMILVKFEEQGNEGKRKRSEESISSIGAP